MVIKMAQINAQRSAAVSMNLELTMREKNLDILCIQEPYVFKGKVRGYTSSGLRVTQPDSDIPWVAIVSAEDKIQIFRLAVGKSDHVMCVQVKSECEEMYIINAYCQFSLPIVPILETIETIIQKIGNIKVLITMDSNAKSHMWFSKETDERGKIVEEFLLRNDLYILNEPNNAPTYLTTKGDSNIDLSLISGKLLNSIKGWRVHKECTTSDHNLITFEYDSLSKEQRVFYKQDRYNIKRADWDKFESLIDEKFDDDVMIKITTEEPEKAVKLFTKIIDEISHQSIPRKRGGRKLVPWWNAMLGELRKDSNKAKKQLFRARKLRLIDLTTYEYEYKTARNKYVSEIKKSKRNTWRDFVTTEGNKDPWSIVTKIAREKLRITETACSLTLPSGEVTIGWKETFETLMRKAVPMDDPEIEDLEHLEIRKENDKYYNCNIEMDISEIEIDKAIKRLKNNKAPGHDGIQNETIKHLWRYKGTIIYNLLNNCFRSASFPLSWKRATITFILKDKNKDKTNIGSYRPISLLPTLAKVYERIVVDRLQIIYKEERMESERQYGFRKRRSTEDAFIHLRKGLEATARKYVVILFVDIEGAFDNLWWQSILARVRKTNCSSNLFQILKDYFRERKTMVSAKFEQIERSMEKGCPQGSILGPAAWNWCMDDLLARFEQELEEDEVDALAYADDLALLLKANSRRGLEDLGKKIMPVLEDWCRLNKLKISASKTTAMLVKGRLDKNRLPIIKMDKVNIKFKTEMKYLGLILDDKMNFIEHTKYLRNKMTNLVMAIRRIAREKWGIKRHIIEVLYNAVALPIVTYGATGWCDKVEHSTVRRSLMATQRSILLLLTKACKTTATVSMQVIAGKLPLDLEIIRKGLAGKVKRKINVTWKQYNFNTELNEDKELKMELELLDNEIKTEWQRRWEMESRGRETFKFIKDVQFVDDRKWFKPARELVYIITGYGPIKSSLKKRNLIEDGNCDACGKEETVEHMIYDCNLYRDIRTRNIMDKQNMQDLINNQEIYEQFTHYVKNLFEIKSTYLLLLDTG